MTATKTALAVLRVARELLASGWTKGEYCDGNLTERNSTCYCIAGAILEAGQCRPQDVDRATCQALFLVACEVPNTPACDTDYERLIDAIADWQDQPHVTQDDAMRAIDRAIGRQVLR